MKILQSYKSIRKFNMTAISLAILAMLVLFLRSSFIHYDYPDGKDVHVLTPPVTLTSDATGDRILFHGKLPQYIPVGLIKTSFDSRLNMTVELEDLGDSDELLIEVWNANVEASIDGKTVGVYRDGNAIHSLASYYYHIPMDASDNGKVLTLSYWRERKADIPWTFPQLIIGTSSELMHHVFFPYRVMIILASAMMYFSFTLIVGLCFYRNRPGILSLIYSFILLLLGTFQIISACPASALITGSGLAVSLCGQIGIMAFPIFLYLFYVEDGSCKRNQFLFLLAYAHLVLGIVDIMMLLFGIGASQLDILLYLSATLYMVIFLVSILVSYRKRQQSMAAVDFMTLILFTLSSFYMSFLVISGVRNVVGLYIYTTMMVVGLSACSYKIVIRLTRNNVALLKKKTLEEKSYKDVLTGLGNRRALRNELDKLKFTGDGIGVGIIYFDLDGMKRCNDTLGHEAGDKMLRTFATAARIFPGETYRIGGDEFVKVVYTDDERDMWASVVGIQKDFSTLMEGLFTVTGYGVHGIVNNRSDLNLMIEEAERGMRMNKKGGRK